MARILDGWPCASVRAESAISSKDAACKAARTAVVLCAAVLLILMTQAAPAGAQPVNMLTFHGDNNRLGWNDQEQVLTPGNVNAENFGKIWETPLDAQIYGSPLYLSDVAVNGGKHDLIYAATEKNSVYALNALDGSIVWQTKELAPYLEEDAFNNCGNPSPLHGITCTPVIDAATGTIYVCGLTQPKLKQVYEIWALDTQTGLVKPGWPITIQGSYHGLAFDGGQLVQRGALNLVGGWLYITFGARCDIGEWHGWVAGVNTAKPESPQRLFSCSPTGVGGGIWCAGGLTADPQGNLYAVTGNGEFTFNKGGEDLCESVLRLVPDGNTLKFSGKPKDYYTPKNYAALDDNDEDLGASGAILLPDQPETSTPRLILTAGKDGLVYLINRDNLGGIGGELQKQRLFGDPNGTYHGNIRSMPAYFDGGPAGRYVYIAGNETGPLGEKGMVALRLGNENPRIAGKVQLKEAWTLKDTLDNPASPVVSSNGPVDAVVWLIQVGGGGDEPGAITGRLFAFDAITGTVIYHSDDRQKRDALNDARKFSAPTVANGRIFIGTHGVVAYGLLHGVGPAAHALQHAPRTAAAMVSMTATGAKL